MQEFCKVEVDEDDIEVLTDCESSDKNRELEQPEPESLFCRLCYSNFPKFSAKLPHEQLVHNSKEDRDALNLDFTKLTVTDFSHSCEFCGLKFLTINSMVYHKKIRHRIGFNMMSKCKVCGLEVKSKKIRKHMNTHSEGAKECKLCYKTYLSQTSLRCHQNKGHSGEREYLNMEITEDLLKFKCSKCVHKFVSNGLLVQHMNNQHGAGECKLCYRNLQKVNNMPKHMAFRHKDDLEFLNRDILDSELKYLCTICNKLFVKETILIYHKQIHKSEKYTKLRNECYKKDLKKYQCKFCYKTYDAFGRKFTLLNHILLKHESDSNLFNVPFTVNECDYECDKCNLKFISEDALKCHIETSHLLASKVKIKEYYKCEQCPETFKHALQFRQHCRKAHNRVQNNQLAFCKLCRKQFDYVVYYQNHVKSIHKTSEELEALGKDTIEQTDLVHSCNQCKDKFLTKNILAYHLKYKHNSGQNYICEQCTETFKHALKFRQHCRKAHNKILGNNPSAFCKLCRKQFEFVVYYKTHIKTIHKTVEEQEALEKDAIEKINLVHSCNQCKEKFLTKNILTYHVKYKHNSAQDKTSKLCKLCHRDFKNNVEYRKHIKNIHRAFKDEMDAITALNNGKKICDTSKYKCKFCREIFMNLHVLNSHVTNLHKHEKKNEDWVCHFCNEVIKPEKYRSTKIKKHMSTVHNYHKDNLMNQIVQQEEDDVIKNFQLIMKNMTG